VDLVIYSLASSSASSYWSFASFYFETNGGTFTNKTVDFHSGKVSEISIEPCSGDDIENTVAVMGGEDWACGLML
jgi:enoyl-[acyl-carrier protein] reductase/trans-2-enoyl-CoA reductase (NAD+)